MFTVWGLASGAICYELVVGYSDSLFDWVVSLLAFLPEGMVGMSLKCLIRCDLAGLWFEYFADVYIVPDLFLNFLSCFF